MKSLPEPPSTRDAVCPTHGAFVERNIHAGRIWSKCPTCEQQWEAHAKAAEAAQRAAEKAHADAGMLRYRIAASGLQGRFLRATFDNYNATTPEQRQALATCRSFAEDFASAAPGSGLWLIGPPGVGKSHLGSAMVSHLIRQHRLDAHIFAVHELTKLARDRFGNKRQDARDWMGCDYPTLSSIESETPDQLIERISRAALFVLDEVGLSRGSEWEREQLFAVLNARYKDELPTVLISNLSAAQLKTELGHAAYDRLREGAKQVPMVWPSHRGAA